MILKTSFFLKCGCKSTTFFSISKEKNALFFNHLLSSVDYLHIAKSKIIYTGIIPEVQKQAFGSHFFCFWGAASNTYCSFIQHHFLSRAITHFHQEDALCGRQNIGKLNAQAGSGRMVV